MLAGRNNVGKSAFLRALRHPREPQKGVHDDYSLVLTWTLHLEELRSLLPPVNNSSAQLHGELAAAELHTLRATFLPGPPPRVRSAGESPPVRGVFCARLELPAVDLAAEGVPNTKPGWSRRLQGSTSGVDDTMDVAARLATDPIYVAPRRVEQGRHFFSPAKELTADARNLTDVLLDVQLNRSTSVFPMLVAFLQDAFPDIETISVITEDEGVSGQMSGEPHIYFAGRSEPVPVENCGTGVEQLLALATAITTADRPRLFLIDEPQAYLHPHAESSLMRLLEQHCEHQYVIATHSHQVLNSRPLNQARLLTLHDGETRVHAPTEPHAILAELGVTAADLWLTDRLLWVEGPSEAEIVKTIIDHDWTKAESSGLEVRPMPDAASRFSARSARQAEATYRFCSQVVSAVSPLPVRMLFLFDRDEKTDAHIDAIQQSSGGRARFLPVRELENVFLHAGLLGGVLHDRCAMLACPPPSLEAVAEKLQEILERGEDRAMFPSGPPAKGAARDVVRGASVLDALFWEFTTTPYDKVRDGRDLASAAVAHAPQILAPLRAVLDVLKPRVGLDPFDARESTN